MIGTVIFLYELLEVCIPCLLFLCEYFYKVHDCDVGENILCLEFILESHFTGNMFVRHDENQRKGILTRVLELFIHDTEYQNKNWSFGSLYCVCNSLEGLLLFSVFI